MRVVDPCATRRRGGVQGQRHSRPESALAELGRRVAARRLELGLTLRGCAAGRDFDNSWLSQVENGRRNPSLSGLLKLSDALEIPIEDLATNLPR